MKKARIYHGWNKDGNEIENPRHEWFTRHVKAGYIQYFIGQ